MASAVLREARIRAASGAPRLFETLINTSGVEGYAKQLSAISRSDKVLELLERDFVCPAASLA